MSQILIIDENSPVATVIAGALFPAGYTVRADAGKLVVSGCAAAEPFPPPAWLSSLASTLHLDPDSEHTNGPRKP